MKFGPVKLRGVHLRPSRGKDRRKVVSISEIRRSQVYCRATKVFRLGVDDTDGGNIKRGVRMAEDGQLSDLNTEIQYAVVLLSTLYIPYTRYPYAPLPSIPSLISI